MVRQWAFSICAAGITVAVIQMLLPGIKLKGMVNTVLSLFLLIAIASPLLGLGSDELRLGIDPIDSADLEARADELAAEAARMAVRAEAENICGQMGIKPRGVRIDIDVTGSTYNIEAITLWLPPEEEHRHDVIITQLRGQLGQAVYISYLEEDIP